jgi:hypothetical protein
MSVAHRGRRLSERSQSIAKAGVGRRLLVGAHRATPRRPRVYQGRRAICGTLARSGIRASELCDLRVGEVRLHDPEGARFRIPDAKTEAGVLEVQMSPELVEEFVSHFDRLRRAGRRTDPDAYAFPSTRGGRIARQRVAQVVGEAATHASERVSQRGLPPLPDTTPHTLRRTYISIALLANRFDVLWGMGQVGHADSKMTLDVYAQLQQRVKREHGRAFDTLVRQAGEQLYGTTSGLPEPASEPVSGHESGHEATLGESDGPTDERIGKQESSDLQADPGMARPGLEPGTPRFSGSRRGARFSGKRPANWDVPACGPDAMPSIYGRLRVRLGLRWRLEVPKGSPTGRCLNGMSRPLIRLAARLASNPCSPDVSACRNRISGDGQAATGGPPRS